MDSCLAKLDEIEQRFPEAAIYDRSLNLRGDVLQAKAEYAAAEEAYKKGMAKAEEMGHFQVAAEALSQLVPVSNAQEDYKKAATYYDEFSSKYAENYLEPIVVASALTALMDESVNRGQEGLDKMETMIDRLGQQENADLEKAVAKYGEVSVELDGAEATIEKLKVMGRKAFQPDAVKAWLLVSRIDIIEKELEEGPKANAEIKTAFGELQSFDKAKLAPYVLARIGDFLRNGGQEPQAVAFFEEILTRPGIDSKDYAYNALAKIYLRGAGTEKHAKAMEYVEWVLSNSGNTKLTEESAYERASFYTRGGQWEAAETDWFDYVSNKNWRTYSPEAWYRLAQARDKRGTVDRAINAYLQNYAKYPQFIEYSIPAIARSAELQKGRSENKKAFDLARLAGLRFAKYLNDSRFTSEFSKLRAIYDEFAGEFADEKQVDPYAN
jgi:tetratricopeptide (TPR) repeat protein